VIILKKIRQTISAAIIFSLVLQISVGVLPAMAFPTWGNIGPSIDSLTIIPTNESFNGSKTTSSTPIIKARVTDTTGDIVQCQYRWTTTDSEGSITSSGWVTGTFTPDSEGVLTSGVCSSLSITLPEGLLYFSGQILAADINNYQKISDPSEQMEIIYGIASIDVIGEYLVNDKSMPPIISGGIYNSPYSGITIRIMSDALCSDICISFDGTNNGDETWTAQMPESDSISLPDGTYMLEVTAENVDGFATGSYVVDTTPPIIQSADDIYVLATTPEGAEVSYTSPDAIDISSTEPAICSPTSGSFFPVGTTTVTCNKTDAVGNVADPTSFSVTVDQAPIITKMAIANRIGTIDGTTFSFNLAGITQDELDSGGEIIVSKDSELQITSPASGSISLNSGANLRTLLDIFGYSEAITPLDLIDLASDNEGLITLEGTLTDLFGNQTSIIIKISMIDEESPVISMVGSDMTIQYGDEYIEQGATWTDNVDGAGDITDIVGSVDTLTIGTYEITYSKTDSSDHTSSLTRTVQVVPRTITITADDKSKNLGETDPLFTYEITSGSLFGTDEITGELSRPTGETAGLYQINQGTIALNDNYELTFLPAILTITGTDTNPIIPTDPPITPTAAPAPSIASIIPVFTDSQPEPADTDVLGTQTANNPPADTNNNDDTNNQPTTATKPNPFDFTFLGIRAWIWLLIIAVCDFLYTILGSRRKK